MSVKSRALWLPLQSLAFGSISGAYAAIGTASTKPITMVTLTNNTNANLIFSIDGVHDHIFVPTYSWAVRDISAMNIATSSDSTLHAGIIFYVKGAPTTGVAYVESMFIG